MQLFWYVRRNANAQTSLWMWLRMMEGHAMVHMAPVVLVKVTSVNKRVYQLASAI